ncbi:hypothetical protein [Paenibacillus sp. KN14-4R]|uniref:hypothetical protein n=1 Tax=Paenibacillus sp. KN14-4R TaxID=3445773 RepID=UPI003F9EDA53
MKNTLKILVIVLFLIPVFGCNKGLPERNLSKTILTPNEIKVKYGDGNELILGDKDAIEKIINEIKTNNYELIDAPLSVGQNFTLKITGELDYLSTGYLKLNKTYFKAIDEKSVKDLDTYIVSLGKVNIQGLLPGIK